MKSDLLQDTQVLTIILSIVAGLFLLSLVRIFKLSRANRRVSLENARMEKQVVLQQLEVTGTHHDSASWRARTLRQFEALRSDLSHRLQKLDQAGSHALKDLEASHQKALCAALAQISELEVALAAKPAAVAPPPPVVAALPKPPPPSLPALPAMETLRVQSLEAELAATKAELALSKQQSAALQRTVLLARRKPVTPMRKGSSRATARSV